MATSTDLAYAELSCKTNFSFLEGASHPEEMMRQAKELGLSALAITDRNGLYGIVRAHTAAKEVGLSLIIGSTLSVEGHPLVLLATSRRGYGNLCQLISLAHQRSSREEIHLRWDEINAYHTDLLALAPPPYKTDHLKQLLEIFSSSLSISIYRTLELSDQKRIKEAGELSKRFSIPILATNHVYYHHPSRQPLHDILNAIRHRTTVKKAGYLLFSNAERHLKSPQKMVSLFSDFPAAIHRSLEIAERCHFSLDELHYIYPNEFLPPGKTSDIYLQEVVWEGAKKAISKRDAKTSCRSNQTRAPSHSRAQFF